MVFCGFRVRHMPVNICKKKPPKNIYLRRGGEGGYPKPALSIELNCLFRITSNPIKIGILPTPYLRIAWSGLQVGRPRYQQEFAPDKSASSPRLRLFPAFVTHRRALGCSGSRITGCRVTSDRKIKTYFRRTFGSTESPGRSSWLGSSFLRSVKSIRTGTRWTTLT